MVPSCFEQSSSSSSSPIASSDESDSPIHMHSSTTKPKIVIEKEHPKHHSSLTITPSHVETKAAGDKYRNTKFTKSCMVAVQRSELKREEVERTTALASDEPDKQLNTPQFAFKPEVPQIDAQKTF